MTAYIPTNVSTGEHGPPLGSATEAALWILRNHAGERGWTWQPVKHNYGVLHVTKTDRQSFAHVESPQL